MTGRCGSYGPFSSGPASKPAFDTANVTLCIRRIIESRWHPISARHGTDNDLEVRFAFMLANQRYPAALPAHLMSTGRSGSIDTTVHVRI